MELQDLIIFQTVAKKGTVTAAAKELNYVQSNITARIHKLEKTLKTRLFNRHHRGMSLTPEGKKLLEYSEKILTITREMKKVLQDSEEPTGKLEIGSVETVYKLPYILAAYNQKYANVELSLYTGVTKELQDKVLNYQLDGAFITASEHHPDLTSYPVFEEELVLISTKKVSSIEELMNEPVLCFSEGCGYRARLENWFFDQRLSPQKMMELGTLETILSSVMIGLGITFIPHSAVAHLEEKGHIYCYRLPEKYSKIRTIFIRRTDAYLTATVEKFIATIEETKNQTIQPLPW